MNWDDCRYCNSDWSMRPTGETRVNNGTLESAYQCNNCTRHSDSFLWVPERKAIPTPKAVYGDYKPHHDDPEYKLAHASAQAAAGNI